jgi:hypothetical protein
MLYEDRVCVLPPAAANAKISNKANWPGKRQIGQGCPCTLSELAEIAPLNSSTYHTQEYIMKKIGLAMAIVALIMCGALSASAQGQMAVGAGVDVLFPVGSFGDSWGTGIGGTAQFEYAAMPHASITGKTGYISWSAKDLPSGITASLHGIPFLVGIKYFSHLTVHEGAVRFYGHLELGLMVNTASGSGHYITVSKTETDFTIVPSIGAEIPAGPKGAVDVSARYFDIKSDGSIGFRVGYKLTL